jgi:hypothetical protein
MFEFIPREVHRFVVDHFRLCISASCFSFQSDMPYLHRPMTHETLAEDLPRESTGASLAHATI